MTDHTALLRADRWADELSQWAIPDEILALAPEPPWSFPTEIWERSARYEVAEEPLSTSSRRSLEVLDGLAGRGTVLDVGAGAGAASLPLGGAAAQITALDEREAMLAAFRRLAEERGYTVRTVLGRWPNAAPDVQAADVVVCNHVLYNVPDIIEFVSALSDHATRRVVMEITATHPLTSMKPLWLAIHGLERPNGPTADDAYDVIRAMGIPARMERSARKHEESDEDRAARVALARRRLCVGSERDGEIAALLLEESREVVTIWWDT